MSEEKNNEKYCIHCWLSNQISENEEKLINLKNQHQENQKYSGYENSQEAWLKKEEIEILEKRVDSWKKQLPDFNCLNNSTCGEKCRDKGGFGIGMKICHNCGKYLSLYFPDDTNYKSPDFYTHEKDCQQNQIDLNLDNQIKSNQIKSNQIKSNQIKSNEWSGSSLETTQNNSKLYLGIGLGILGGGLVGLVLWLIFRNRK